MTMWLQNVLMTFVIVIETTTGWKTKCPLTYRKYISNCPNSNGWPRRMRTSLNPQMKANSKYSFQNAFNTATMSDGLFDFANCWNHVLRKCNRFEYVLLVFFFSFLLVARESHLFRSDKSHRRYKEFDRWLKLMNMHLYHMNKSFIYHIGSIELTESVSRSYYRVLTISIKIMWDKWE